MYNALRLSRTFVIWLAVGAVCASGCYRPRLWVAPEYRGPQPRSAALPRHACRVCTPPACFGYHAGQWRPWPCPDPPHAAVIGLDAQAPGSPAGGVPAEPIEPPSKNAFARPETAAPLPESAMPTPDLAPVPGQSDVAAPLPKDGAIPSPQPNASPAEVMPPPATPSPSDALPAPTDKKPADAAPAAPEAAPPQTPILKTSPPDNSAVPSHDLFSGLVQAVQALSIASPPTQGREPVVSAVLAKADRYESGQSKAAAASLVTALSR